MTKYILVDDDEEKFEEFDNLEEAREGAIEKLDDGEGVAVGDLRLFKVDDEYSIVSSKKVLFKKVGGDEEE